MTDASPPPPPAALPRGVILVLGSAGLFITFVGIRVAADIFGPVFLALMLAVAVSPAQAWLEHRGLPRWAATLVNLALLYAVLAGLAAILVVSVARLVTVLPQYTSEAQDLIDGLDQRLENLGVGSGEAQTISKHLDLGNVLDALGGVLGALAGVFSSLVFLLALLFFMGIDAGGYRQRIAAVSLVRPEVAGALSSFARGTRRYLVVSTIFGVIVGVIDTVALALIGIPLAVLWGLLSFITNYIPNVGFVIGLIPPALLGLLEGGVDTMLVVIALYSVINFVIQTIIQPKVVGDTVNLSVTTTFLALTIWAWVLGPLGALLAVPLTLLAKALLVDIDPATRWITALVDAHPPPVPPAPPPPPPEPSAPAQLGEEVPTGEDRGQRDDAPRDQDRADSRGRKAPASQGGVRAAVPQVADDRGERAETEE
jgi:AI-2 transport protein TqsA